MSLDEKLKILEIDTSLKDKIKSIPYEAEYLSADEFDENTKELKIIDLDELVGMCRTDADRVSNWLEALEILVNKGINFSEYKSKEQFEKFILSDPYIGYPLVTVLNNKYYIQGEGKHRLTIAKCLGLKKAKVIVIYPK